MDFAKGYLAAQGNAERILIIDSLVTSRFPQAGHTWSEHMRVNRYQVKWNAPGVSHLVFLVNEGDNHWVSYVLERQGAGVLSRVDPLMRQNPGTTSNVVKFVN